MKSSLKFSYPSGISESKYDPLCISCSPPEQQRECVTFSEHWNIIVVPQQFLPGYCLIVARRHVASLTELSIKEWTELFQINQILEPALIEILGADLVNHECLRNNAYRVGNPVPPFKEGKPNPHVHWHVMPRFSKPKEVLGRRFSDQEFGSPYRFKGPPADWELCDYLVKLLRPRFQKLVNS